MKSEVQSVDATMKRPSGEERGAAAVWRKHNFLPRPQGTCAREAFFLVKRTNFHTTAESAQFQKVPLGAVLSRSGLTAAAEQTDRLKYNRQLELLLTNVVNERLEKVRHVERTCKQLSLETRLFLNVPRQA